MAEARLQTVIWVQACVRRGMVDGITVAVLKKGDPEAGSVLVRLDRRDLGCSVLAETRDKVGRRAWLRGTGALPVTGEEADAYIDRSRRRDPDLWVIEVDDRAGRLPFDDAVLDV
jgi:hypothetical protein